MSPEQKLKHAIILRAVEMGSIEAPSRVIDADTIDALWDAFNDDYQLQDATQEIRCSGVPTGLQSPSSRHYESTAVAGQMPDGSWVGWVYWFGGGKHGEPDEIDWMDHAYDLNVVEEEKLMVVRTFSMKE